MKGLPFQGEALPPVGGRAFERVEDFRVEELRAVAPSGEGDHTLLRIEKRGVATMEAVRRLARALGVPPQRVGYAGLKDAHAVAEQDLTIEGVDPERVRSLEVEGVSVLEAVRHHRRLKRGALRGNRFTVVLRETGPQGLERARAILDLLAREGVRNAFGHQRFGAGGRTQRLGEALFRDDAEAFFGVLLADLEEGTRAELAGAAAARDLGTARRLLAHGGGFERRLLLRWVRERGRARRALAALDRRLRALFLSAAQAAAFNVLLAERGERFGVVERGDLAWIHTSGAVFLVDDAERERERAAAFEISPSGPLAGPRCRLAEGVWGERERHVLGLFGLDRPGRLPRSVRGARRPLRVALTGAWAAETPQGVRVGFELPPGAYAGVVVRELVRSEASVLWAPVPDPSERPFENPA